MLAVLLDGVDSDFGLEFLQEVQFGFPYGDALAIGKRIGGLFLFLGFLHVLDESPDAS